MLHVEDGASRKWLWYADRGDTGRARKNFQKRETTLERVVSNFSGRFYVNWRERILSRASLLY